MRHIQVHIILLLFAGLVLVSLICPNPPALLTLLWLLHQDSSVSSNHLPLAGAIIFLSSQAQECLSLPFKSLLTRFHRLVHRLDRDTSGAIILARTQDAAVWLSSAFQQPSQHLKKQSGESVLSEMHLPQ